MDALKKAGLETIPIGINQDIPDDINTFQIYGSRPFSMEKVFEWMKQEKRKIVYDVDDALALTDKTNPWYYAVKKDMGAVEESLRYADILTVSTPLMEEYMRTLTKKPIIVVPNCYTPSEWAFPRPTMPHKTPNALRIGFAGSATHVADLVHILPTIKKLQDKYDITFIIMGFSKQSDYQKWYKEFLYFSPIEAIKELKKLNELLTTIKFEFVPYVNFEDYPATLTNMALDIGICPLIDTPFNRCKSACKAMEYTLSGAVSLASDVEPYKSEVDSILVSDGNWEDAIEALIKYPDVRKTFLEASKTWIEENRNMNSQIETLKKVYGIQVR